MCNGYNFVYPPMKTILAGQESAGLPPIDIPAFPGNLVCVNSDDLQGINFSPIVRPRAREGPTKQPHGRYPDNIANYAELNQNIGFSQGLEMCISRYMHGS